MRLAELVIKEPAGHFDFTALCRMHQYIFQDVYEWADRNKKRFTYQLRITKCVAVFFIVVP